MVSVNSDWLTHKILTKICHVIGHQGTRDPIWPICFLQGRAAYLPIIWLSLIKSRRSQMNVQCCKINYICCKLFPFINQRYFERSKYSSFQTLDVMQTWCRLAPSNGVFPQKNGSRSVLKYLLTSVQQDLFFHFREHSGIL